MAARSEARKPPWARASAITSSVRRRISSRSCSTQPVADRFVGVLSERRQPRSRHGQTHEARAGCALIDGSDVIFQGIQLPRRRILRNGRNWRMEIVDVNEACGKEKETIAFRSL